MNKKKNLILVNCKKASLLSGPKVVWSVWTVPPFNIAARWEIVFFFTQLLDYFKNITNNKKSLVNPN